MTNIESLDKLVKSAGDAVKELNRAVLGLTPMPPNDTPRPSKAKYGNIPQTGDDGHRYDSGKQFSDAQKFKASVRAGEYLAYFPDVRIPLLGGVVLEIDHVLINKKLELEFYETKGWDSETGKFRVTPASRMKLKLFKATYGKEITII